MRRFLSAVAVTMALTLALTACLSEADERVKSGKELQEQERLEEAIAEYDEAIRLDPQLALAYAFRGVAYTLLDNDAAARPDVERAIQLEFDEDLLTRFIEDSKRQR